MELAIVVARLAQFVGAVLLFGTPLFLLYGLEREADVGRRSSALLSACAGVVLVGSAAGLSLQTAAMAGDPAAGLDRGTLLSVLTGNAFGAGILARLAACAAALIASLSIRRGPRLWLLLSALGAVTLASFAWTGHGASDDGIAGKVHAAADVLHLLAAGVWLGALTALVGLLAPPRQGTPLNAPSLHRALAGFSRIGSAAVATILATGLVNGWFLVGPSRVLDMVASPYGLLLLVKVGLFIGMLGLAATNRFFLTPELEHGITLGAPAPALAALRRSIQIEAIVGLLILLLVSVLGTLAPVAAQ